LKVSRNKNTIIKKKRNVFLRSTTFICSITNCVKTIQPDLPQKPAKTPSTAATVCVSHERGRVVVRPRPTVVRFRVSAEWISVVFVFVLKLKFPDKYLGRESRPRTIAARLSSRYLFFRVSRVRTLRLCSLFPVFCYSSRVRGFRSRDPTTLGIQRARVYRARSRSWKTVIFITNSRIHSALSNATTIWTFTRGRCYSLLLSVLYFRLRIPKTHLEQLAHKYHAT